ncbi:MAG TPA: hypothetical protein ENK18_03280, partial [Deltaproteobacteria bacterium]|nr:hypothetical protein [Deltaproteobacteria bacterium]
DPAELPGHGSEPLGLRPEPEGAPGGEPPGPAAGDPAAGDPAAGDPAAGDPAAGDPAAGDPAAGGPAAGDPAAGPRADGVPPGEPGVDAFVRSLLLCPRCRGELVDVDGGLCCEADGLIYPIVDGVFWMIEERARSVTG